MIELCRQMAAGHVRTYAMMVTRSLFGDEPHELTITHGRKGWRRRTRRESFETFGKLAHRARALYRRRIAHHYVVVLGSLDSLSEGIAP